VSIFNVKIFTGASPQPPFKKEGKGRKGGKGEERGGEGRKGEGMEGSIPKIKFYDYST
jgi:hypothetical protein